MATMKIGGVDVPAVETVHPEDSTDMPVYVKQTRKTEVLPKGWKKANNKRALDCDTVYDQNITIALRDGTRVYADVFRPDGVSEKVPAILGISPYGKGGHGGKLLQTIPQMQLRTFPSQGSHFLRSIVFPPTSLPDIVSAFSDFLEGDYAEKGLFGFIYYVRGPLPQREPAIIINFNGLGPVDNFNEVFSKFLALDSIHDTTTECESIVEFSHVIDDILLAGSPRKSAASAPLTGFWPNMVFELWEVFLDYTNSTPDSLDTKIFLEYHNSIRYRPEGTCIPYVTPRHSMVIASEEHNDPANDAHADA